MSYVENFILQLKNQVIDVTKESDFEAFWQDNVSHLRSVPLEVKRSKYDTPYEKSFVSYNISYNTHDDTWVDAYFSCPVNAQGKVPCVVFFHGGSLKKTLHPEILALGVACLSIDTRGQGGTTIDKGSYSSGFINGSHMTRGILDKNEFYMKNIYLDAVRAMDVAASLDEVDSERIVTYGGSQGGALSIVASALSGKSKKCYSAVTSLCCLKQRILLGSRIFGSVNEFLRNNPQYTDKVFEITSYFDIINMVSLLNTPTSFCLGTADPVCLPEFVYSAYAHTPCEKQLDVYPFVQHEIPNDYSFKVFREISEM